MQLDLINREALFTADGGFQHFQPIGGRRYRSAFKRRHRCRNKHDFFEVKAFPRFTRHDQMPMMNGIEGAAVNSNSSQFESIQQIRRARPSKIRLVSLPGCDNLRGRDATLELRADRSASVNLEKDIELAATGLAKHAFAGGAVYLGQHIDADCGQVRIGITRQREIASLLPSALQWMKHNAG